MIRVNISCMEYINVAISAVECIPTSVVMHVRTYFRYAVCRRYEGSAESGPFYMGWMCVMSSIYEIFTKLGSYIQPF